MEQTTGLQRNNQEKYYTKKAVVLSCLQVIKENISIHPKDVIIEPSAGNGSFSIPLNTLYNNVIAYDLYPDHKDIIQQDYLSLGYDEIREKYKKIHVIGNPPFGRQSTLAKKFIKKSCEYCDTISFILPKSFKKDSFQKIFPLCFHMIYQIDLPEHSFQVNGTDYNVPCVFQIWIKRETQRDVKEKVQPTYYSFVKKNENPDLSIRRVGVYAGQVSQEIDNKSPQSHYFIRLKKVDTKIFLEKYRGMVSFEDNNTVGPKSISKPELINEMNKLF